MWNIILANVLFRYLKELEQVNSVSNWGHFSYKSRSLQRVQRCRDSFELAAVSQESVPLITRSEGYGKGIMW